MTSPMVFIVTQSGRARNYSERVLRDVVPHKRNAIIALEDTAFGVGDPSEKVNDATQAAKNIADFIDVANSGDGSFLLVDKENRTSLQKLVLRWEESGNDPSHVYKEIGHRCHERLDKIVRRLGYHWRSYAQEQLERFEGQITPLDKWVRQFVDLKVPHLGQRLLMQLQVVGFGDQDRPFSPRMHETLGQNVLHCYFDDGDYGGSWISVQDQLSHDFPEEIVQVIKVADDHLILPETNADELVIYEDGLWSGSETVKRLRLIKESNWTKPIRLKFLVVTDFGLMVARHAVRYLGLENVVRVDACHSRIETFLKQEIAKGFSHGRGMEPEEYTKRLQGHVELSAFQNPDDWPEGIEDAQHAAETLGRQLVKEWYQNDRLDDDADSGAEKFCLGGGRFASTMVFTNSVPKVCLPLFWLSGQVSLNGESLQWEPLFRDARRIDPKLLRV